ncbi:MAG: mechanosensitive ion channel [Bdellovibrionota bacterium]
MENINFNSLHAIKDKFLYMAIEYAPKVLLALATLMIGLWLINIVCKIVLKVFAGQNYDQSLQKYLVNLLRVFLKLLLFVTVIQMIGIKTTSLVAMLGAAGLAVGLALQGSLSNFAGGVLILIFKPFVVGDYIRAQGLEGSVQAIQVFATILITLDGKKSSFRMDHYPMDR